MKKICEKCGLNLDYLHPGNALSTSSDIKKTKGKQNICTMNRHSTNFTWFPQGLTFDLFLRLCLYWGWRVTVWTVGLKSSERAKSAFDGEICCIGYWWWIQFPPCVSLFFVHVCHCLHDPPVFYACHSLGRQWLLTMKCYSGWYVSKLLRWKNRSVAAESLVLSN